MRCASLVNYKKTKLLFIVKKMPLDSLSFLCDLLLLLLLFSACRHLRCSSGINQTLLVCSNDAVVESLVELGDDVTSREANNLTIMLNNK